MVLTGNFDLYYLIVELVFGNLMASFFAILFAILVVGVITKMSMVTVGYIETLFATVYLTLWFGTVFLSLFTIAAMSYFGWMLFRWLRESAG